MNELSEAQVLDRFVRRASSWLGLVLVMIAVAIALHGFATAGINRRLDGYGRRLDTADSLDVAFRVRMLVVAELAVVAIADEDETSRREAIAELRRMRRVMPR